MYIGYYKNPKISYHRMGSDLPLPPTEEKEGCKVWHWKKLHNSALDIRIALEEKCFVGSVSLPFDELTKVYKVEVIADGRTVGVYAAETNSYSTGEISVAVGEVLSSFTVRIYNAISIVTLSDIRISVAMDDGKPVIWPTPKSVSWGEGSVSPGNISDSENDTEKCAANILDESLYLRFGRCVLQSEGAPITLKLDESYPKERITVSVNSARIIVAAGCRLSLLRAACILATVANSDGTVPVMELDDTPTCEMRGFHLGIPARRNIEFNKKLYRFVLLPLGYNQIFMQFCGGMRYDRHPEISEAWLNANRKAAEGKQPRIAHDYMGAEGEVLEKDEVRDLVDYAKELGFEIIPEVQSLGHVQYLTNAHKEISEIDDNEKQVDDEREEDLRPADFYPHCYCPSNEESYRLIFDIIDEVIEVARPERYLHIGHDEVYHLGLCSKCRGKSHAELFVGDVMRLYNYLKEKGLGTMMWGDMLQPVTKYDTKASIDMLPKDIIQLDFIWYFHPGKDIETNLLEKGYTVLAGNLYSSHYPRYRKRMLQPGMNGGQISTWCALSEYAYGKKGKFWDTTYTAQMLANPELYDDDMRWVYSHVISKLIQPLQRDIIRGKYSPEGWERKAVKMPKKHDTSLPIELLVNRKCATLADGINVKVGACYERLAIEHTTKNIGIREPWVPLTVSGYYTVNYADGDSISFPAEYAGGVQHLKRRYGEPFLEWAHRHTGYSGTWFSDPTLEICDSHGERILLTEYIWENPHPEKKIASVSYKAAEDDFTEVVITGISGLNRAK
ncbi:MAG: family 20 glycosylhydrolase [Clostridia bacterium]|nr:family 20 glycosylhydrolase [Clostridia bacterium]